MRYCQREWDKLTPVQKMDYDCKAGDDRAQYVQNFNDTRKVTVLDNFIGKGIQEIKQINHANFTNNAQMISDDRDMQALEVIEQQRENFNDGT